MEMKKAVDIFRFILFSVLTAYLVSVVCRTILFGVMYIQFGADLMFAGAWIAATVLFSIIGTLVFGLPAVLIGRVNPYPNLAKLVVTPIMLLGTVYIGFLLYEMYTQGFLLDVYRRLWYIPISCIAFCFILVSVKMSKLLDRTYEYY